MNLKHEDTIKKLWEIVDGANVAQVPIISSSKGEDTKENGTNGVEKKTEENIPKKKTKRTPDSDEEDEITMAKLNPVSLSLLVVRGVKLSNLQPKSQICPGSLRVEGGTWLN